MDYLDEDVTAKARVMTESLNESKQFDELWKSLYELIKTMVEGEVNDGGHFLSTLEINTATAEKYF